MAPLLVAERKMQREKNRRDLTELRGESYVAPESMSAADVFLGLGSLALLAILVIAYLGGIVWLLKSGHSALALGIFYGVPVAWFLRRRLRRRS